MADNRTMAQLLQAPTVGYEDAIVIPEIEATNFELKHAWDRFNDLLRACPHHGFSELHQLDTFYNSLNVNDQDSLNSTAGGNFLDKMPSDYLKIIESKSKVRQSRAKVVVAKVNSSSSTPAISSDVAELKDMVRALLLDKKNPSLATAPSPTPAPVKAVESNCVTCGSTHSYQNCPATSENVYQDNIQEYVSQAAAANYNQGNTGFCSQMVANQIRPPGFPPVQNNQKNFNRGNNFNQNLGGNFNQSNFNQSQLHRPQVNQPPTYQAPAYQAPIPQMQSVSQTDFKRYVKANDAVLRNIQSQGQSTQNQWILPGNTITKPKEDLKGITTRSGVAYQGPTIPTPSKVVKQGTVVTKDQVQTLSSQSTAHVQPLVAQSKNPVSEPVSASMPNLKPSIPYPSRCDNERRREQANEQIKKFYEIFKDMSFKISFTDALILMPKFASTLKALIENKEKLSEMARNPINEHCLADILNKLPKKLGDPDKFLIPCEFLGMDECLALADLGASINLMPLSVPTLSDDPIVSTTSPMPTSFGDSDFLLFEEANAFLSLEDDPDSPEFDPSYYDPEGDILMLEAILNSDPAPSLPDHEQSVPSFKTELKACEAKMIKSSVDEPPEVELKDLPPHLEYAFLEGDNKFPVIIAKELGDEEKAALIKVLKSHKRAIAWKLSDIQGINLEFYTHKILMEEDYKPAVCIDYRKLNETTRKDYFPFPFMDQMLERLAGNEYYCFLDGFSGYFQIPIDPRDQEKTTFTYAYRTFAYRRTPFGLCNAPGTFQRYKMLQRCEDTKLCLNWEKSHFVVKVGIVLGHKISKNRIEVDKAKVDVITKLPHPTTVKGVRSFLGHTGFY
nr:reverse transcriptase domain-containing protein [Tanacetum cinerariifolium]